MICLTAASQNFCKYSSQLPHASTRQLQHANGPGIFNIKQLWPWFREGPHHLLLLCFLQISKQQLQTVKDRFQAFLNGETQIVADEAFMNAVQSYYEVRFTAQKNADTAQTWSLGFLKYWSVRTVALAFYRAILLEVKGSVIDYNFKEYKEAFCSRGEGNCKLLYQEEWWVFYIPFIV